MNLEFYNIKRSVIEKAINYARKYDAIIGGSTALALRFKGYCMFSDIDLFARKCPGDPYDKVMIGEIELIVKKPEPDITCAESPKNYLILIEDAEEHNGVLIEGIHTQLAHKLHKIAIALEQPFHETEGPKFKAPKQVADAIMLIYFMNPNPEKVAYFMRKYDICHVPEVLRVAGSIIYDFGFELADYFTRLTPDKNLEIYFDFVEKLYAVCRE